MKFVRLVLMCVAALISTGCATQQGMNILAGVGAGAIFGAVVGDTTEAAKRGALLGGIAGALIPTQTQAPTAVSTTTVPVATQAVGLPAGYSCRHPSFWDGKGCFRPSGTTQTIQTPTFPSPQKGLCDNPYQINKQGQAVFNGRHPC